MNRTKKNLKPGEQKRVVHIILPEKAWKGFDLWRKHYGYMTTAEAMRALVRKSNSM